MSTGWREWLTGTWKGTGTATFPTIETVRYAETLTFQVTAGDPCVHYEQRTRILTPEARRDDPLHWESGFLEELEDGGIRWLNAQNSGRVEVLRGRAEMNQQGAMVLTVESLGIHNDERMLSSGRRLEVTGNRLACEHWMATTAVNTTTPHLEAVLHRSA